jgi:hypothetical protein
LTVLRECSERLGLRRTRPTTVDGLLDNCYDELPVISDHVTAIENFWDVLASQRKLRARELNPVGAEEVERRKR